jgi:hypothetical protein
MAVFSSIIFLAFGSSACLNAFLSVRLHSGGDLKSFGWAISVFVPPAFLLTLILYTAPVVAEQDVLARLGLVELAATFDANKIKRCTPQIDPELSFVQLQQQALFHCLQLHGDDEAITLQWSTHPIYSRLYDPGEPVWLVVDRDKVVAFEARLYAAMSAGLSTGYNIVPHALWPEFDETRTVIYGHSNWQHVRQLVALLHTEGLYPRVVPLLKKSAFVFRDGWGDPRQPLKTLANGQRIIDQVEFDIFFEFATPADVESFAKLVTRYAKKDSTDEAGLLAGSWWQPFYRTLYPRIGADQLTVMLLSFRGYRTNLMGLPEQAAERIQALQAMDNEWDVTTYDIWVNPGFYRNQFGEFK